MDEKTRRALVEVGAVRRIRIVGAGARFHVEIDTAAGVQIASLNKGGAKTWGSLDASAKWVRALGIGIAQLDLAKWQPDQRGLAL